METPKPGFILAVVSGKGGTGKTLISTNLFKTLSNYAYRVTLVDCDAEEPNAGEFIHGKQIRQINVTQKVPLTNKNKCVYCGKCAEYCTYNAIFFVKEARVIMVMDELCHGCGACVVACEPYGAITEKDDLLGMVTTISVSGSSKLIEARMKPGVHSPVRVIKEAIPTASDSDILILDSPPGTSCPFIQTVKNADFVILVTEPTPFGLSDLKQSVETLKSIGKSYGVIVNRAGLGDNAVYNYLNQENIPLLMKIPFDRNIARIYSEGKLMTNEDTSWQLQFNQMYNLIVERYGNSCYKW